MTRRCDDPPPRDAEFFRDVATIPDMLKRRAELSPNGAAFMHRATSSAWTPLAWEAFDQRASVLANAFAQDGLLPGTRVGILAATSVHWEIAQMAALRCGAVVCGLDPYYPDALLNQLIQELQVAVLVVQDPSARERISKATQARLDRILDIDWVARTSETADGPVLPSRALAGAAAVVTLTSGSTGRPQPIVFSHAQVVHAVRCIVETYPLIGAGSRLVAWLPLANLFQRMIDFCAIAKGATSYVVSDPRQVMEVLPTARPHVLIAVPLFCERVRAGIDGRLSKRPAAARLLARALGFAGDVRRRVDAGQRVPRVRLLAFRVVDRLMIGRLRAVFGSELRFIVTGSAPMPRALLDWFAAIGIPVLEAYGASENVVPIAANRLEAARSGTVGRPMGDNELRIGSNGEVEVRGFGVFDPALAENALRREAITPDGFLVTGDLGSLDRDGYLTLRGRSSEVFKNAQGRWVSLPLLELALREIPQIDHAAAIRLADDRVGAVVTLGDDVRQSGEAGRRRLRQILCEKVNHALSQVPPASRPVAILVAKGGFTPASGEMTTNLKLRRHAIAARYEALLQEVAARRLAPSPTVNLEFE